MFASSMFGVLFFLPVGLFGILALVFWIWMLIDAIQNPSLSGSQRIVWVLVIILVPVLGPLIYLLAGRRG
jgi:Phospholipase_D-nuclease N-terminal